MDNYENSFDTLVNYLKMMPKATIKMLNIPRYLLFMKTADQLQKYLAEAMESGEMVIKIDEAFYHGCITVEMEDLTIERPQAFLRDSCSGVKR